MPPYVVKSMKTPVQIRIDYTTREALRLLGRKGQSYDDVLRRVIRYWALEEMHKDAYLILDLLGPEEEAEGQ